MVFLFQHKCYRLKNYIAVQIHFPFTLQMVAQHKQCLQSSCFLFLKTFYFVLGYSRLTMLGQFQVNSEGTQPYTCMSPFLLKLSTHPGCHVTVLLAFLLTKTIHVGGLSTQYIEILSTYFYVQRSTVWIYHNFFNHLNRTFKFFSSFCNHKQGHNEKKSSS